MTIVVSGGGSGGHITPILAVAAELKKLQPGASIVFIGARGSALVDLPESDPNIDATFVVNAGKFRRYHGEGARQAFDFHTQYLNAKDLLRTLSGVYQSWKVLGKVKPGVVFTRGGFVSVPVALAAKLRGIPYITHDSDSTPSLANRIIAPMASKHAVALEPVIYPYDQAKTVRVGVPISSSYHPLDAKEMKQYRAEIGLSGYKKVICITGGGNGAETLNKYVRDNAKFLLNKYPDLAIAHIAGRSLADRLSADYDELLTKSERDRVLVRDFVTDLYHYSGAADVIIARGGATNLAEFAAQRKACIIIPNEKLIWNIRNAEALAKEGAIIELREAQAEQELRLATIVCKLLDDQKEREALAKKFAQFYIPDSAQMLAKLLIETAK